MIDARPKELHSISIHDNDYTRKEVADSGVLLADKTDFDNNGDPVMPKKTVEIVARLNRWDSKSTGSSRVTGGIMSIRRFPDGNIKLSCLTPITITDEDGTTATAIGKLEIPLPELQELWDEDCMGRLANWRMQVSLTCSPFAAKNELGAPDTWPKREGEPYSNSEPYRNFGGYVRLYNTYFMLQILPRELEREVAVDPITVSRSRSAFSISTAGTTVDLPKMPVGATPVQLPATLGGSTQRSV